MCEVLYINDMCKIRAFVLIITARSGTQYLIVHIFTQVVGSYPFLQINIKQSPVLYLYFLKGYILCSFWHTPALSITNTTFAFSYHFLILTFQHRVFRGLHKQNRLIILFLTCPLVLSLIPVSFSLPFLFHSLFLFPFCPVQGSFFFSYFLFDILYIYYTTFLMSFLPYDIRKSN